MKPFQQILTKYDWPKRTDNIDSTIKEIESMINFVLPSDYNEFLKTFNGSEKDFRQHFVRLWDAGEIIEQNKSYNIVDNLPKTIGIGTNGAGEFIAIVITSKDNYKIVLSPFIDLDEQYNVEIGESFTDFLIRLDNGQEWFSK